MKPLDDYRKYLEEAEKSDLTIEKYLRDAEAFLRWLGNQPVRKEQVLAYKAYLTEHYAIASVNSMLSAVNHYLTFLGREDCRVRVIRRQRQMFCSTERELTRQEYQRLVNAAQERPKLQLLLQTICATGIRVSEHRFITVEAAKNGVAQVNCKGKLRTVLLPRKLCLALLKYAREVGIRQGSLFVTRNGTPLDRSYIWAEMKNSAKQPMCLQRRYFLII